MKHPIYIIIAVLTTQVLTTAVPASNAETKAFGLPVYFISMPYTKKPVNENMDRTANKLRTTLSKWLKNKRGTIK